LAILVVPPALDIFRIQGTGVLSPSCDRLYPAGQPHDICRGSSVDRCAIPYLPIVVLSPTFDAPARGQDTAVPPPGCNRARPSSCALLSFTAPFPSSRSCSLPPHLWTSRVVKAQVCRPPAVIAFTPLVSPTTSAGVILSFAVPSPN